MKNIKFYLVLLVLMIGNFLNAQSWQWAKNFGGSNTETVVKSKNDSKGNFVLAGWFMSSSITFGSTTHNLTSLGYDSYITKVDSTGTVLWSKKPNCNGGAGAYIFGSTIDNNDNIIICGNSDAATIDFGNGVVWANDAPSISNLFIVKYNENGVAQWVYNTYMANASGIQPTGITCDNNNNIYCTGIFSTINYIGFSGPISDTLENGVNNNSFLLKLNSSGSFNKVKHAYGDDSNSALNEQGPKHINFGKDGNLYLIGCIQDLNDDSFDPYIRKLDVNLSTLWTKTFDTNLDGYFNDIEIDNSGNSFVVGHFNGTNLSIGTNILTNPNSNDENVRMIASLDNGGSLRWQKLLSGTQSMVYGVALSPSGSVLVGASFRDTVIFNIPAPLTDIIVFSLNPSNGSENWNLVAGNGFNSFATKIIEDIICDEQGRSYVIGFHADTDFPFGSTTISTNGQNDIFSAKIGYSGLNTILENNIAYFDYYPNPVDNILYLASDNSDIRISISDLNGKVFYEILDCFYQSKIDMSTLKNGIYFINVQNKMGNIYKGKFIKY